MRILTVVDAGYGVSAGLVIVIGICRVISGHQDGGLLSGQSLVLDQDGKLRRCGPVVGPADHRDFEMAEGTAAERGFSAAG